MTFMRGDTCYILEENKYVQKAKVMRKQGEAYFIQFIGSCGAVKMPEDRLFKTQEEAEASRKTTGADVNVQLTQGRRSSDLQEIPYTFGGRPSGRRSIYE